MCEIQKQRNTMHIENLVKMANDIGAFFAAEPDRDSAVRGIADHIRKFWDPRMRRSIIEYNRSGGDGLVDLAKSAIAELDEEGRSLAQCGDG